MKQDGKRNLTLRTLTKGSVWEIQENDVFRLWEGAEKDVEVKENPRRYVDIIKTAFIVEELSDNITMSKSKYESMGYRVAQVKIGEHRVLWAIRKKPIMRVSDLTYENIMHISATKLVEVLDRNFGGGWDSLSQSVKDIIECGFEITTTTLPANRLHKPGGMYEKKLKDGFEVLEVPKGTWTEAIFIKVKPQAEKPRVQLQKDEDELLGELGEEGFDHSSSFTSEVGEPVEISQDEMTEENYMTTFDLTDGSGVDEDEDDGEPDEELVQFVDPE